MSAERWAEFEDVGRELARHTWSFASTMIDQPHFYSLKRDWEDKDRFEQVCAAIKTLGYDAIWGKWPYRQLDVNEWYYWTMPSFHTPIINCKDLRLKHDTPPAATQEQDSHSMPKLRSTQKRSAVDTAPPPPPLIENPPQSSKRYKYTPATLKRVWDALSVGATRRLACQYAGIHEGTFANWLEEESEFAELVESAEGQAAIKWLALIDQHAQEDWRAAAWKLERRYPDEYGRKTDAALVVENEITSFTLNIGRPDGGGLGDYETGTIIEGRASLSLDNDEPAALPSPDPDQYAGDSIPPSAALPETGASDLQRRAVGRRGGDNQKR